MKQITAIALLVSILASPIFNMIAVTDYALRYSYYVEVLCENKDNLALHCNGKCHLAQNLKAQSNPEKPTIPDIVEFRIIAVEQDVATELLHDLKVPAKV